MLNFPVGLGPVPWIFNSEIYPLHLRAIGYSMLIILIYLLFRGTSINWFANFLISIYFLTLIHSDFGEFLTFEVIAFFCVLAWFFSYFVIFFYYYLLLVCF